MCFSAEASFSAAAGISIVGFLTCKSLKNKQLLLFAIVPFLFALQQFSEGMIWLSLGSHVSDSSLLEFSKTIYLIFAFLVWPLFFPFSIYYAEPQLNRKKILGILTCCGLVLTCYFVYHAIHNSISINVINHSIQYELSTSFGINTWVLIALYSTIVLLPCFISSLELIWSYGIFLIFSWIAAEYFYQENFTSTWCFFSALLSCYIYFIVRANEHSYLGKKEKENEEVDQN